MKFFSANKTANKAATSSANNGFRKQWLLAGAALAFAGGLGVTGMSMAEDTLHPHDHAKFHVSLSLPGLLEDGVMRNQMIEKVIAHVVPDGSEQQKAELGRIVKVALQDLRPIYEQNKAIKDRIKTILQQPQLDRNAMEQWRQDEMRLADNASKRVMQAVADCGDILTPEQRVKLAQQLERRRG